MIMAMVNKILGVLLDEIKHFTLFALAVALIILWSFNRLSRAVRQQDLSSQALLRSTRRVSGPAGNFYFPANESRGYQNTQNGSRPLSSRPDNSSPDETKTYFPPEARIIVRPKDKSKNINDLIDIEITKTWGLCLEPGLSLGLFPFNLGADVKFFYLKKFGLETGLSRDFLMHRLSPEISLSYRLDSFNLLRNTELKFSYTASSQTNRVVNFGLRVNL